MSKTNIKKSAGFTLLEILLVVGIIAILAGIVILAINPTKQLGDARNAQRRSDVMTILSAIYQYSIDEGGDLSGLTILEETAANLITAPCGSAYTEASSLTALSDDDKYLIDIPVDPLTVETDNEYYVVKNSDSNRITVCAPNAENDVTIEVTR
jgi:prepilin-type N-terminal cleavage/methylation domain-containing protein